MSGLSRTPGKRVYDESRTVGSNPTLSAMMLHYPIDYKQISYCNIETAHKITHRQSAGKMNSPPRSDAAPAARAS